MALSITSHRRDDEVTLFLAGEIDIAGAPDLDAVLAEAAHWPDVSGVVVDLSALTFTDSTGIGALIRGRRLADANGKRYTVVSARHGVREVLDLAAVWHFLHAEHR